jgi:hypothetical protein
MELDMKSIISVIVVIYILLSAGTNLAAEVGYFIEERAIISSQGSPADTFYNQVWLGNNKFRRMMGENDEITIGRLDKGLFWMVNSKEKTYFEADLKTLQQFGQFALVMMGAQMKEDGNLYIPDDLYRKTGEKKKIGDWEAEKVTLNAKYLGKGILNSFTMWISQATIIPEGLFSKQMLVLLGGESDCLKNLLKVWKKLGGYPVSIETDMMGIETILTTTKIEKVSLSDDFFTLPAGLKKISNPMESGFNPEGK